MCNDDVNHRKELCSDSGKEAGTGLGPFLSKAPAQMHRTAGPPSPCLSPPHAGHFQVPASETETPAAITPHSHLLGSPDARNKGVFTSSAHTSMGWQPDQPR